MSSAQLLAAKPNKFLAKPRGFPSRGCPPEQTVGCGYESLALPKGTLCLARPTVGQHINRMDFKQLLADLSGERYAGKRSQPMRGQRDLGRSCSSGRADPQADRPGH